VCVQTNDAFGMALLKFTESQFESCSSDGRLLRLANDLLNCFDPRTASSNLTIYETLGLLAMICAKSPKSHAGKEQVIKVAKRFCQTGLKVVRADESVKPMLNLCGQVCSHLLAKDIPIVTVCFCFLSCVILVHLPRTFIVYFLKPEFCNQRKTGRRFAPGNGISDFPILPGDFLVYVLFSLFDEVGLDE